MLRDKVPRTSPGAEYGTPEIAKEIRLFEEERARDRGPIVLGGHREGIIAFGKDPGEAVEILLRHRRPPHGVPSWWDVEVMGTPGER